MLVILAMKIFLLFCNKMLYNCKTILYTSRAIHLKTTFYRGIKMTKTTWRDVLGAALFGLIGGATLALVYVFKTGGF